jgi:DNA-binding FadR family transcriptional regulator
MIKNVHGNTVDFLGEAIVAGRYAEGGAIPPEPVLCEELGISRTVVREAIKSLVAKGLIHTDPKWVRVCCLRISGIGLTLM